MGHRVTTLNVNTIEPAGNSLTLGASGDTIVATDSVNVNTVKDLGGVYRVDAFTGSGPGTWTCPTGITSVEILVVGGGGGGGGLGGGGGAGGVVHHSSYTVVPAVVYDITVGAGGAGVAYDGVPGNNGVDSVFNVNAEGSGATMTALGGGGGSSGNAVGGSGGSGGGGNGGYGTAGGSGTQADSGGGTGYGEDGGDATYPASGGGGGATTVGADSVGNASGSGGAGKLFSNFVAYGTDSSNVASTGSNGGYFGGGGGGNAATGAGKTSGDGGVGGGADGQQAGIGDSGLANTGGGQGGGEVGFAGGSGGAGVVLIRYIANPNTLWVSDGSGNLSSVNSAFNDSLVLISSQTASGSASISFTSGITSTYQEYIFKFYNINPATDNVVFQFQAGSSSYDSEMSTTTFTAYHDEANTTTALTYWAAQDQAAGTAYQSIGPECGNGADECSAGELHLFNPASITYVKNWYGVVQQYQYTNMSQEFFPAGYFNISAAITQVQFKMSSGNFDGIIQMYGVL